MTPLALDFQVPRHVEAQEPAEARGISRDEVRLLVGWRSSRHLAHRRMVDLPTVLRTGDLLVVNTSATMPAAVPAANGFVVHFSTERPDGTWLVELRRHAGGAPFRDGATGERYRLHGGAVLTLLAPYSDGRLWVAIVDSSRSVVEYLYRFGQPIRYAYVSRPWPLECYQTVFGTRPGSAEMPSAGRPFTHRLMARLHAAGVRFAPVLLHTGVASPEAHERPYPEYFEVSPATARLVTEARGAGRRVIAVGTTSVRALESAAQADGTVIPSTGWTDLVVTPERGVWVVDGLLTGFHEPRASHLDMLAAVAGPDLLADCYAEALEHGYLWHEFGDVNLLLP